VELIGVEPHILVRDAGKYSAGADPIFEAGLDAAAELVRS
jgi:hypothetical protein